MTLQEILYGTWTPPEKTNKRSHRIGFDNGYKYTPPKIAPRCVKIDDMNNAQRAMYERLKHQVRHVSAADMGKKMKITTNHAGILLGELFKLGKVTRYRETANGTRYFMYEAKKG